MKKFMSMLVMVCMMIAFMPITGMMGLAYGEDAGASVRTKPLNFTEIPDENNQPRWKTGCIQNGSDWINDNEGWTWNTASNTLTLDGVNFKLSGDISSLGAAAILMPAGSTIVLKGDNHIEVDENLWANGLYLAGNCSIVGAGSLNIEMYNCGYKGIAAWASAYSDEDKNFVVSVGNAQSAPEINVNMKMENEAITAVEFSTGTLQINNGFFNVQTNNTTLTKNNMGIKVDNIIVGENAVVNVNVGSGRTVAGFVFEEMTVKGNVKVTTGKGDKMSAGLYTDEAMCLYVVGDGIIQYSGQKQVNPVTVLDSNGQQAQIDSSLALYLISANSPNKWYITNGKQTIVPVIDSESGTIWAYFTYIEQTAAEPVIISAKPYKASTFSVKANLTTKFSKTGGYNDVKVSWTKHDKATAYKVYYKKGTATKYTYLTKVAGTSYSKKDLASGAKYTFKVVPVKGTTSYGYKTATVYTLKKLATPTVTKTGTKVKVKWVNIEGETGYQISKSTKKTGTNIVSTYVTTKGSYKVINATKGKTYYYKVRAYKTVGTTKIYGPWSAVKAFKR